MEDPLSQIISTPVSPARVNVHAVAKTPNMERKKVNPMKGKSVARLSPLPNTALTLRKSTPISYLQAHPPASPSSWVVPTQHMPNNVDTRQKVSKMAHHTVEAHMRVPLKAAAPRFGRMPSADNKEHSGERSNVIKGLAVEQTLALSSSKEGEGRRVPDAVVSTHNGEKNNNYPPNPSTAFMMLSAPTSLSVPPVCAAPARQPSDDQIPPIKVISGRQGLNVVSKTSGVYSLHSPSLKIARKQSVTPPVEGEGQLARAAAYIQERLARRSSACNEFVHRVPKILPDKMMEPVTQRHDLDVISEEDETSINTCSPEFTVESTTLSHVQYGAVSLRSNGKTTATHPRFGETPLAGVLEHSEKCSVVAIGPAIEQVLDFSLLEEGEERAVYSNAVVSTSRKSKEASSPETLAVPMLPVSTYALSPVLPAGIATPHLPLDCEWRPEKIVNSLNVPNARLRPPRLGHEAEVLPLALKSSSCWAGLPRFLGIESWWRTHCKPPNEVIRVGRRLYKVISIFVIGDVSEHSPEFRAGSPILVSKPNHMWADSSRFPRPELVWRVLKPPDWAAIRRSLNRVVGKFEPRRRSQCSSLGSTRLVSSPHVFHCLHTAIEIGSH